MTDFNLLAKDFDTDRRIKRSKIISDEIRTHIDDGHKKIALEYGCGTGLVGFNLIHDFASMVFVDSSSEMIEQVNQKLLNLGKTKSYALCCDFMTDMPKGLSVDYVFASLVLHHVKNYKSILYGFYNILCEGGHLIIVDKKGDGIFYENHPKFDGYDGFEPSALAGIINEAGFCNIETKTFYHHRKTVNGIFILDATLNSSGMKV